jgi:hypothetical protein|tara:strand:+ start:116 stop:496 length:381 start_codon:yes stop_codon:yes gene_type:complete
MARVDSDEVKELISTDETITAQINAANVLVTEKLGADTTLTTDHLKEIERWVSAHLVACSIERQAVKEKIGATAIEFVGSQFGGGGLGWSLTTYGQQVLVLDTTGILANAGKRKARVDTVDAIDMT